MAGLLGDVLPYIYQRANALKRGIGDFVADPMGSIAQGVNYANDRAGGLLAATRAAADEGAASGGLMYGPANQKLAGILANAYNPMGITVYHGSPHKFAKFDSSKIGTGEGAQAYGHGLYLAESEDVGRSYQQVLASPRNRVMDRQGVYIEPSPMGNGKYLLAKGSETGRMRGQVGDATQFISDVEYPNIASAIKAAKRQGYLANDQRPLLTAIGEDGKYVPIKKASDTEALLGYEPQYAQFIASDPGHLYKVDLPDSAVARMLDWDKPLSQQAQNVRDSLDALRQANPQGYQRLVDDQLGGPLMEQAAGMDLYRNLIKGANERQMAEVMRQQGIPGIRYLDGGSRGQGGGTSNFVIFPGEESLLTILERNGLPLPK